MVGKGLEGFSMILYTQFIVMAFQGNSQALYHFESWLCAFTIIFAVIARWLADEILSNDIIDVIRSRKPRVIFLKLIFWVIVLSTL